MAIRASSIKEWRTELTWSKLLSALITLAAILFAIQGRIDTLLERGIREDMNNTDAMINRRIDSLESRLNSWRNTAEQTK